MHRIVEERTSDLAELCRRFGVRRLELFGSAAGDRFDPDRSDLDFLVELEPADHGELADHYFGLLLALEELFGRRVDLVMPGAIRNPYFRQSIERSRVLLYAA